MKIDEVLLLPEATDDWQSQLNVAKMWDIARKHPGKRDELAANNLSADVDKGYDQLDQAQRDTFKHLLGQHLWRIMKAQRNQPGAANLQRELELLNRKRGVDEDAKDDPNHADTQVANANPAQAPQSGNPAKVGNAPQAGKMATTTGTPAGQSKTTAGAAYNAQQNIAGNAAGKTAAAQQAAAGAKETVPVLPSDRDAAQKAKLTKAKAQTGALPLAGMTESATAESGGPAIGDYVILELANGRAIHAPIAELRGNSMVLALDETGHQWLDEAPDHEHLKIQGAGRVSPVAMSWNSMIDDLAHDTPEGWAAMFKARSQDKESARKWGKLWRQQHVNLGDDLSLDDQRAWEDAVFAQLSEMDPGLEEQEHVFAKTLNSKDRVLTKIYMDARRKGTPLKKYAQDMAVKAGMPVDHYWHKIKPLVNEDQLSEADAHATLWPIIVRVLGRKLYTGKNSADIYSYHTPDGIEIHGAVTRGLKGNEALELEQALHAAGIPIEKVTIEPDMIRVSLRGEMDEATPAVLGMNENAADPYSPQTKYYIVRKDAGLNAIPGKSGSHTMAAARKQLAQLPDADRYEIRAINTTKIPQQQTIDEDKIDHNAREKLTNIINQALGLHMVKRQLKPLQHSKQGMGWLAMLDGIPHMPEHADTILAQALVRYGFRLEELHVLHHADNDEATIIIRLAEPYKITDPDYVIEADDVNTLSMLKDSYLDGPKAAVKEANLHELNLRDPKYDYIDHGPWQIIASKQPVVMGSITGPNAKYVAKAILKKDSRKQHIGVGLTQNGAIEDVSAKAVDLNRASLDPDDYESYVIDFNVDFTREYMDPKTGHFFKFEKGDDGAPRLISAGPDWYAKFGKDMEQLGFRKASNKTGHKQESQIPTYSFPIGKPKVKELGLIPNVRYTVELDNQDADGNDVFTIHKHSRYTGVGTRMMMREPGFILAAIPKGKTENPPSQPVADIPPLDEAKYHGKTVKLGKPIRTNTGEGGKFKVYVKDPKTGNIKMVRFGDTTGLTIKRDDPKRRKSFRARHHCENPGPRTKANFWSCKMWTRKPVGKILKGK